MTLGTFYSGSNRVLDAIEKARVTLSTVEPAKLATAEAALAIDVLELAAMQDAKSRAQVMGLINVDEAMTIYTALGEAPSPGNGGWAPGTDVATKYVVTSFIKALLERLR